MKNIKLVTDYLDRSAETYREKIAFGDENRTETFGEVYDESRKIAAALIERKIFGRPVAVFMDKRVECINAMLGVAYSGNFYTVLDVHMPETRITKILEVLKPEVFVTDAEHKEQAENLIGAGNVILFEDAVKGVADDAAIADIREKTSPESTLYVLFTSGSTGTPKGVIISHKAVIPYLEWISSEFGIDDTTVFANQTPFYFVMSGLDIYMTIFAGAACHVVPKRIFSFPVMLLNFLKEHKVNTLYWVPSILCLLANFRALPEVHLDELRLVMFGGEVMPSKQLNMWRKEYPDVEFVNQYGPTEMTDIIAFYRVDREIDDNESLPIGRCASHMKILLLDENGKEVPEGEIGELCGTGPSLADGYYNMPEKTAEVFVKNPTDPEGQSYMYCTGDLARVDENGDLIYMGRKDFQIKHMGNRIELGEIETAVSSIDGILQNCCLYDMKRSKIVLFYTGSIDEETIDEKLKAMLPEYMIPNRMEKMESMPLNLNGKIDRAALKELV